jgi:CRP/FNR family transcriptional regulator, anaerobic regulatory protein
MNALKLKRSFDKYFEAPVEVWKSFTDLCDEVKFKKNEVIKEAGRTEKNAYFILEGACGVFLWKPEILRTKNFVLDLQASATGTK